MARNLADAAGAAGIECVLSLSSQNPGIAEFSDLGRRLIPVSTFDRGWGALTRIGSLSDGFKRLRRALESNRCDAVIVLMPHVWTPFIVPRIRALGLPVGVIVHDVARHPGDPTALMTPWLLRSTRQADRVFTLSRSVADGLMRLGTAGAPIVPLFHPDLHYSKAGSAPSPNPRIGNRPLRILFCGRILPYKGLSLFVDALERLKRQGRAFEASVVGEGALGKDAPRLRALGVRIINRWIRDDEVMEIFNDHDVVALTHTEASQSGVVAVAFAQGLPVVVTPVGGLVEQVLHETNGIVSVDLSGEAVAAALGRLIDQPELPVTLRRGLAAGAEARSAGQFLKALLAGMQG
jgi:glycosyltransferase involved in cell wall biosynthesis